MFKKYLLFILMLPSYIVAMQDDGKKYIIPLDLSQSTKVFYRQNSSNTTSPRNSMNANCLLLQLPDELLLIIIMYILEPVNLDQFIENDPIHLKEVYHSVKSFGLSCFIISRLIDEAILNFYLERLKGSDRFTKIELANNSYNHSPLSLGFCLTSILDESHSGNLFNTYNHLKKFISKNLLSIDQNSLNFTLSQDDDENLNLIIILLHLKSFDDNLVTDDSILHNVLLSPNNKQILNELINNHLSNIVPNSYMSTDLMKAAFNGETEIFASEIEIDNNSINAQNDNHFTAIIWGFIGGHTELLDYIFNLAPLEQLMEPNQLGQNLLHFVVLYADLKTLQYLLSKLSTLNISESISLINKLDNDNRSPLSLAIQYGNEGKTLVLLNHKADLASIIPCNLNPHIKNSKMLKKLIKSEPRRHKIAQELYNLNHQTLTSEDIINCCKNVKQDQNKRFTYISVLAAGGGGFVIYGESLFSMASSILNSFLNH